MVTNIETHRKFFNSVKNVLVKCFKKNSPGLLFTISALRTSVFNVLHRMCVSFVNWILFDIILHVAWINFDFISFLNQKQNLSITKFCYYITQCNLLRTAEIFQNLTKLTAMPSAITSFRKCCLKISTTIYILTFEKKFVNVFLWIRTTNWIGSFRAKNRIW